MLDSGLECCRDIGLTRTSFLSLVKRQERIISSSRAKFWL